MKKMKKIIINPSKIKKIRLDNGPFFLINNFEINSSLIETSIIDGDWDINTISFEDFYIFKSTEELINGKDWKETALYNHLLDQIEKGNPKWGCINQEMVEKRGEYILDLYNYIKENKEIPKGYFDEDDICVSIDRNGSFIFSNNGTHRLCIAKILGIREIPVRVYNIHQKWNEYRLEVKELCDKLWDGKTYQNLPHPDFSEMESMWSDDRFDAIKNNTDVSGGTLLDIGSLFGNICYQAEQFGYDCTAVETDNQYLDVMKKLHKSYYMSYKIIENSFLEMGEIEYDIIVAYNIFHHFLKSETLFNQLNAFLDKITFKEMFIQTHKTTENQMSSAFMNFDSDEFAKFIAEKTNKKNYTCVGVEGGRKIYKIF
jgi:2-polyprenyl-3-methyl-5-hydroxy-6-metoxy-1,4-benzoquinol methylase